MESAQDKITKAIVEAEELWLLEVVDKERYICRGCGVKVTPASYQPHNVVRPYFTLGSSKHLPDCNVDGEAKLVGKGKKGRLSTPRDGFPVAYPAKLELRDHHDIVDAGGTPGRPAGSAGNGISMGGKEDNQRVQRKRGVNTIRQICRTFINFPHDRDLELTIPGIRANTYSSVFKKLKWNELAQYPDAKLFYAPIRWSKAVETDDHLEVTVDAGTRDHEKRLLLCHRVRVEWTTWSKFKRSYVRNEIEAARKEAIEAHAKHQKYKGYLFFIGEQAADDPALFRVTDHRLICCLVDEIIYPSLRK